MVVDALLRSIADRIRTVLSVDDSFVRVMPDAYPIPSFELWFISIYGGKFKIINDDSTCFRGPVGINLCMTCRHASIPFDKQGVELTAKATTGIIAIWENALKAVNKSALIIAAANTAIGYNGVESVPIPTNIDFEAKQVRGGGPVGWMNAQNQQRAGFIFESSFKVSINIQ